jgi:hypothetical protein
MRARRDAGGRRLGGLLLAVALVVSQASAWLHAVGISHVACPEHGEAIHGGAMSAESAAVLRAPDGGAVRADLAVVAGHDHCANAALLRWRDVALTAPAHLATFVPVPRPMVFAPRHDAPYGSGVYRLAPKTSPPFSA